VAPNYEVVDDMYAYNLASESKEALEIVAKQKKHVLEWLVEADFT
jgi:hypothetical protein